ncbi:hypothetical protein L484_015429 [Morus notabilis]|uniref:VQ domain-containing protein n=1 Tax=Morus notabilis TaxID=981085 RepID=W9RYA3_9ROSA|nr:VQ motif-containing protein 8, chloroplastic [Morus notabilis]EXB77504.1 hypothetical protein L484_015429 [Morus notabilis]
MSPEKFIKINGARPSPLKINKESHTIYKPSNHHQMNPPQRHQPVIIYTHSPRIIHTEPRNFMAVVQNLTGMSRSNDNKNNHKTTSSSSQQRPISSQDSQPVISNSSTSEAKSDNNESSSVLTDEINNGSDRNYTLSNPSLADIPLFTPNFFCSPRAAFRFPDATSSPNLGSSSLVSPSFLEFMKGLPEY